MAVKLKNIYIRLVLFALSKMFINKQIKFRAYDEPFSISVHSEDNHDRENKHNNK